MNSIPRRIVVGNRLIGGDAPTFVVAEIGCNFEGEIYLAREMIQAAAKAGADAVKFQTFVPEKLVIRSAPKFWEIEGCPGATQFDEFKTMPQLSVEQYLQLKELADACGLLFFSTPSDEASADLLQGLGVPAYKIGSMDITHFPLLKYVARKGKPIILSTGASTIGEIDEAIKVIEAEGNRDIVLLHCITNYPTRYADANLRMMIHLQLVFPDYPVGYSDHTITDASLTVPTVASALGATVIEKHFTFDKTRPGYDHVISMDYEDLRRLKSNLTILRECLGSSTTKGPLLAEANARQYARRSVVARIAIPKGTVIEPSMLAIKRPGTGIEPRFLGTVIGKIARQDIVEDEVITWDMI